MEEKELLRNFLYRGELNVEQFLSMKQQMMLACGLGKSSKDRAVWANWVTCKCAPNRWCKKILNDVVMEKGFAPIYHTKD